MIDEEGGGIAFTSANVFFQFPAQALSKSVVFTCTPVRHNDCKVKQKEGEFFCSNIIKMEPKVDFKEPVTVLLSHSAREEQPYADYYDVTVQQMKEEWTDLETSRIRKPEGIAFWFHYVIG